MKMKTAPLIDAAISAIGFGCWAAGGSKVWSDSDDVQSQRAICRAVERGVNFFDVAPIYGAGHAEKLLAKALGTRRSSVLIATKVGIPWDEPKGCRIDLSPHSVMNEIDLSLARLRTDYVDIYQLHWPDPATPIEATMEALVRIQHAGKIRAIGISNHPLPLVERARKIAPVVSFQGLYNMLERNPKYYHKMKLEYRTESEILPYCKAQGMAFFPYSPLLQGLLTNGFRTPQGGYARGDVRADNPKLNGPLGESYAAIARQLQNFAREIGRPLNQIAINWLVARPEVISVIAGAQNERQADENTDAVDWELDEKQQQRIEEILRPYFADGTIE
jgi:aryl-alcohol dehydrogenase-like predicted oxidoreductase